MGEGTDRVVVYYYHHHHHRGTKKVGNVAYKKKVDRWRRP